MDSLRKLQQAGAALEELSARRDLTDMEVQFGLAVSAMVASRDKAYAEALKRVKSLETSQPVDVANYRKWWAEEVISMEADPLISWVIGARNDEQHLDIRRGGILPRGSVRTGPLAVGKLGPNERVQVSIDGVWIVTHEDTPYETRRRPGTRDNVSVQNGQMEISFALLNMPSTHLGEALEPSDPMGALRLAFDYFVDFRNRCVSYTP